MAEVLVLAAHPNLSTRGSTRGCCALRAAAARRPGSRCATCTRSTPTTWSTSAAEQAALAAARLVVWQHPVHWYGMPPLMKLWLDEVFAFGWAYGPGGTALRGKDLWLVASTGGPERSYRTDGYNRYFFDAFLPPYEQTAALAGMRMLPPLLLHGAHRSDDAAIEAHAALYAQRLASYPDWPELADLDPSPACEVPADARPAE